MPAFVHDSDSDDRNLSFFMLGLQSTNLPILQPKKYEHGDLIDQDHPQSASSRFFVAAVVYQSSHHPRAC